jgi:hypothetical protein
LPQAVLACFTSLCCIPTAIGPLEA